LQRMGSKKKKGNTGGEGVTLQVKGSRKKTNELFDPERNKKSGGNQRRAPSDGEKSRECWYYDSPGGKGGGKRKKR